MADFFLNEIDSDIYTLLDVQTMEPPAHYSSSYSRSNAISLPPLMELESRPRSSMGYYPISSSPLSTKVPSNIYSDTSSSLRSHGRSNSGDPGSSPTYYPYPSISPQTFGYAPEPPHPVTNFKTFACDICGSSFSRAYDCKRHRDIHTRQGKHACPYCHKNLSRADALKRHIERGCSGMEDEDMEDLERERERKDIKKERRSSAVDASKYYSSTRR